MATDNNDERENNLKAANREKEALEKKNAEETAAKSELRQPDATPEKTDAKDKDESKSNKQENVINNSDIIKESASELSGWAKAMTEMLANMIKLVEELRSVYTLQTRKNDHYGKLKRMVSGNDKNGPEESQAKQEAPSETKVTLNKPEDTPKQPAQSVADRSEELSKQEEPSPKSDNQPSQEKENKQEDSPKPSPK